MKHDIAELNLSVRAYNCLKQAGIHYVEDVSEMSDADLLAVRHLGVRCLHEVREKVAACEHGMSERDQLMAENAKLRELVRNLYKRFHGVVLENWSYSAEDFDMLACRMRELGIEVEG